MRLARSVQLAVGIAAWVLTATSVPAAETNVAVAANFTEAAKEIAAAFKAKTGHEAVLSFGASGQFYTQITQGAPFQVFLSADAARPKKLVEDGLAVADSRFTYSIGKLVLWSKTPDLVKGEETFKAGTFAKLSICNPAAAPYGAAAVEAMKALKIYETLQPKLVEDGLAVADSRVTYSIGKLVLWSKTPDLVKGEETLKAAAFAKLSICNPAAAPYGAAAVEAMKALNIYETLQPKLVEGATITQAYQFVETGNAELGFVALSQLTGPVTGSRWVVPQELYSPIRQDAVLLKSGASNEAATGFISFLKGPEARAIIEKYGYVLDGQS